MQSINTCANWNFDYQQLVSNLESFFRPLFRLVPQRREAQKRPWRRSHASLTSDLEHSKVFLLLFFLCACILWDAVKWKTSRFLKNSEIYSLLFYELLELKQSQMKTATTMAPNKRLQIARSLSFFCTFIRVCMEKTEVQGSESTNI